MQCFTCIECDKAFYAGSVQLSELDDTRDVMLRDQIQTTSLPGRIYQVETAMKDQHGESLVTRTSTSQAPSKIISHLKCKGSWVNVAIKTCVDVWCNVAFAFSGVSVATERPRYNNKRQPSGRRQQLHTAAAPPAAAAR